MDQSRLLAQDLQPPQMPELNRASADRLQRLLSELGELSDSFIGYPCAQDYNHREIMPLLEFAVNNVGDPFAESIYRENTFAFEREVIGFFQRHLRAPQDGTWGYMTAGGTEGNLYGLYLAREALPNGIIYFSEHTHYSAAKLVRVLGARSIMIRGQDNGEIDYEDLKATIELHRDIPPIILANIGTTMHGAVDNLDTIRGILKSFAIPRSYIHADAALSGMLLPWVDAPQPFAFDAGLDSVSVSGHKFIGSPMPCGVVLAKRANVDRVAQAVEYVGCSDTTIAGSRNAITPVILWLAIERWGEDGFRQRMQYSLNLADYAIEKFAAHGIEAWRHPNSITVVFPRPAKSVIERWQIAPSESIAHLITLPHVTTRMVDKVVTEIASTRDSA